MRIRRRPSCRLAAQSGQTFLFIIIFIALFLIGVLGIATDYTQIWARRQMVQAAADAACQAGAADLYLQYASPDYIGNGVSFTWIGAADTSTDCSAISTSPPCKYAAFNGYSGSSVSVSFPSSLTGVTAPPSSFGTVKYIKVTVSDAVPLSFTKILSSAGSVSIKASAGCGLNPVSIPIPLVVLHKTASSSLSLSGTPSVQIFGGPNRSIQVDSSDSAAVNVGGSGTVDLSAAGPSNTGADFGVFGGPTTKPGGVTLGTGSWKQPSTPLGDPWVTISAPSEPGTKGTVRPVAFGTDGCPDPGGCAEFSAGDYAGTGANACSTASSITYASTVTEPLVCLVLPVAFGYNVRQPSHPYALGDVIQPANSPGSRNPGSYVYKVTSAGTSSSTNNNSFPTTPPWNQTVGGTVTDGSVTWTNIGALPTGNSASKTAIFNPGLYYVGTEGLQLNSGATVRPSTATGDGSGGPTFYFAVAGSGSNPGTVSLAASTGSASPCTSVSPASPSGCVVSYTIDGTALLGVTTRALQCPSGPANPSQTPATEDGNVLLGPCSNVAPGNFGSSDGTYRGFLFFQNHSTTATASWGGGSGSLIAGFMYFHNSSYGSQLTMSGGSSSAAYTLGNIVSDKITMGGSSGIKMILNPAATFQVLKPQLLQ